MLDAEVVPCTCAVGCPLLLSPSAWPAISIVRIVRNGSETGAKEGDVFTLKLFERLHGEEMEKLRRAGNRDVHDVSKETSLPIAGEIVEAYLKSDVKPPWYIDLLNINLNNYDLATARKRIRMYLDAFAADGTRVTKNLDFAQGFGRPYEAPIEGRPASYGSRSAKEHACADPSVFSRGSELSWAALFDGPFW